MKQQDQPNTAKMRKGSIEFKPDTSFQTASFGHSTYRLLSLDHLRPELVHAIVQQLPSISVAAGPGCLCKETRRILDFQFGTSEGRSEYFDPSGAFSCASKRYRDIVSHGNTTRTSLAFYNCCICEGTRHLRWDQSSDLVSYQGVADTNYLTASRLVPLQCRSVISGTLPINSREALQTQQATPQSAVNICYGEDFVAIREALCGIDSPNFRDVKVSAKMPICS